MQSVYIIGSKGIPANYGGFETFVDKLILNQRSSNIKYYVACTSENSEKFNIVSENFEYKGATCFNINVPNIGPAKAIYYDVAALNYAIHLAKKNRDKKPIFYILACRIGPFIRFFKKQIQKIGGTLLVNPDGHEWLRAKWSYLVRKYWKYSERLMVKYADLLVCDSQNIESYIQSEYSKYNPKTTFIAYGTDSKVSTLTDKSDIVRGWFRDKDILEGDYYLVVGRFVPENNYESMIKEFMKSNTQKDFVLITNVEHNKFYEKLKKETLFDKDKRVKFVGTVYEQELLKYIRENAFAYFHGHEVGGTNPSLLEALSSTKLNLLLDVGFNREVAEDGALFWEKNNLNQIINEAEKLDKEQLNLLGAKAKVRVLNNYSWEFIVTEYEKLFLNRTEK